MGNTIISSLLFQPPTPANELDYFGNVSIVNSDTAISARSAHNDSSNETVHKSKSHFVRGGGSAKASRQQPPQQQVVVSTPPNEPSLHYIWLVSTSHPTPIPALHITWANNNNSSSSSNRRSTNTPSNNRYTLLYSHGNAEDIGLLAKFLTDISKLLQCDILVYDYSGYGVSVDRRAVLRFYAVWGGKLEEWRRWRRENKNVNESGEDSGRRSMMREGVEDEESGGGGAHGQMNRTANGVCYSMDVFMAPMVFPKGTTNTAVSGDNAGSTGKKETNASSSAASSTSTSLNLPDSVYVCGDELDFIDEDATTATMTTTSDDPRTASGRSRRQSSNSTSATTRENSLLDMEDDYDYDYDDDTDMPSVTVTCYDNSTCNGDEYDYDDDEFEDEVSLFTCGASCNEVEHSSIVGSRLEEQEEDAYAMMRDDVDPMTTSEFGGSTKLSSSIHQRHSQSPSSPRSVISGGSTTATTMSSSSRSHHNRRRRPNRQNSMRAPLSPKQKRRALLRKHRWTMPSPSEEQCYGDILLAYNYLLQIREVPAKHVLLYGKSVGSGPTCWLAQRSSLGSNNVGAAYDGSGVGGGGGEMMYEDVRDDGDVDYRDGRVGGGGASGGAGGGNKSNSSSCYDRTPGGVILHSPFLSVIRVVLDMGFTTVGDLFPNIDRVKDFTCPVYIIHGTEDEIVPYYHGQGLFNELPDTSKAVPFWANGAGHNNIEMEMPTAYIKRLMQFIRQCDRLNYPAGELQRTRAFSSGSNHGSGNNATSKRGSSSSQQELDSTLPNNLGKYTRQMSALKQRKMKKGGPLVMKYLPENAAAEHRRTSSSLSSSHQHSNSPTMAANITMSTMAPKRRQGRSHRNSSTNSTGKQQQQQQQAMHHGKYYQSQQRQHQSARDQYPSVETNLSTDAAMCGIQPSIESKYYAQYLQHQQQQQQQQQPNYY
eukprot:CAMPEP_0201711434 /NCGR_PEP_ID=MMETSP0578-20130828/59138_1 /ASSEMBLY_ACC=CAM_ASM_000663 /TAXON_ID=267565 /ORGANISM="Skeletonema grethea, Strain CCMP 1804" /LENGTH=932 /DNA_ID=CAMNT_0048200485 /DNA_START=104 /DNA_END=2902 /DNA_ORIENTATION=-